MKSIVIAVFFLMVSINSVNAAIPAGSATFDCGVVKVLKIASGQRQGTLMLVNNPNCKFATSPGGWICLVDGYSNVTEQKRLYSTVMSLYLANRSFQLSIYDYTGGGISAGGACGSAKYPVVDEMVSQ